jgi:hypothetical protein
MLFENSDQDINSDCNPDIGFNCIFGHDKRALIHKRCMTVLKNLDLIGGAKARHSSVPQKDLLKTQNMVLIRSIITKCAISQSKNKLVKIIP